MRISDWSSDVCSSDLNAGAACQKRGNHKQLRNGLHRTLPIYMINVFYKELSGVATGNRSRPLRGMRRSIRKIAVAENASIAARKIIGARSLPVASWIFGTTACATKPPRLRSEEHTSELQSLMRISYDVFGLKK